MYTSLVARISLVIDLRNKWILVYCLAYYDLVCLLLYASEKFSVILDTYLVTFFFKKNF